MIKLPGFPKRTVPASIERDAETLIASYGPCAYDEARTRARDARLGRVLEGNRAVGHWDKVRREIARLTSCQVGMDTATRYII